MQTPVETLSAEVTYLAAEGPGRFDTKAEAERAGGCVGVEIRYHCPYCDAPNVAAYTTPVPEGLTKECDHCSRDTLLATASSNNRERKQYHPEDFESIADRLEKLRRLRLAGERDTKLSRRHQLVNGHTPILGLLGTLLSGLVGAASGFQYIGTEASIFLLPFFIGYLLFFIGLPATIYFCDRWPAKADDEIHPQMYKWNNDLIEHGRKVARDEEALYVPPKSVLDEDEPGYEHGEEQVEEIVERA